MQEGSEGRLLNRVLRVTPTGWEVEADQRHADLIIKELDLEQAHGVIIPGEKEPRRKEGKMRRSSAQKKQPGIAASQQGRITWPPLALTSCIP